MKLTELIKISLILLLVLIVVSLAGCKSNKPLSEVTKSDTVTVIKEVPVYIKIKTDTTTFNTGMDSLYQLFQSADNGTVLKEKHGKRSKVIISKTKEGKLSIDAVALGKDTTVHLTEKTTTINTSTAKVYEKKESLPEKIYDSITRWVFWVIILVIGLLVVRRIIKI